MPSAMAAAFMPGDAGADDDDLGGDDAGDAAHQHAAAALGLHQRVGADLRRQAAGDLASSGRAAAARRSGSCTVS